MASFLLVLAPSPTEAASPQLVDNAAAAGITFSSTPSWDVCVADFDGDGKPDFHASLHMKDAGALYRNNNNGTFTRTAYVPDKPLLTISPRPNELGGLVDRHACAWADVDGNGLLDMYSSAGRYSSNRYKDEAINNELWLQTSAGVFKDAATAAGVGESCTRGRFVVFDDYSRDGLPDLFLGAQKERVDSADRCNTEADYPYNEQSKVFVNRGAGANGTWLGFRYAPEFNVSQGNVGVRAALSWDENRDGLPDLLTVPLANHPAFLHRHTGTGFMEVARAGIVKLPLMNGAKVGDITGDGIADLVYADNAGFAYRRGTATGISTTTVRIGSVPSSAVGWSVALGDANGDGTLDVYGLVASADGTANPDDVLYVGAATGTSFQAHAVPSAGGEANDVEAVIVNGRAQFVVLNGGHDEKEAFGPVQLIAWR
jgi:hypothetical protein